MMVEGGIFISEQDFAGFFEPCTKPSSRQCKACRWLAEASRLRSAITTGGERRRAAALQCRRDSGILSPLSGYNQHERFRC